MSASWKEGRASVECGAQIGFGSSYRQSSCLECSVQVTDEVLLEPVALMRCVVVVVGGVQASEKSLLLLAQEMAWAPLLWQKLEHLLLFAAL